VALPSRKVQGCGDLPLLLPHEDRGTSARSAVVLRWPPELSRGATVAVKQDITKAVEQAIRDSTDVAAFLRSLLEQGFYVAELKREAETRRG
jgi:hypothetical protein